MEEAEKTQNQYTLQEGVAMLHAVHTRRHHQKARKHGMAASAQNRVDMTSDMPVTYCSR